MAPLSFELDSRLAAESALLGELPLCRALLRDDAHAPWLILVPRRAGLRELHQLDRQDRAQLIEEAALASQAIERLYQPDKINIGALGNLVPQFHLHIIGRRTTDIGWPGPLWGKAPPQPLPPGELARQLPLLRQALGL